VSRLSATTLRKELARPWQHGTHYAARGAEIAEPVRLDGMTLCGFDLSAAHFARALSARGATFRGLSWLHDARIEGTVDFAGATFRTDLRLDGLRAARLDLSDTRFEGVLRLDRARVGEVVLDRSCHLANVSMAGVVFERLGLKDCEMLGGLWLEGARIRRVSSAGLHVEGRRRDG